MKLTEFLLARIAEDEADARAAYPLAMTGERWKHYPEDAYNEIQSVVLGTSRRMLAECEAKRRIVEMTAVVRGLHDRVAEAQHMIVLALLALPYADHPDYDEAWRP